MKKPHLFVRRESSEVILPSGMCMDWSQYGPDYEDAIITFNDFRDYGRHCLAIGIIAGIAVPVVVLTTALIATSKQKEEA